LTQAFSQGTKMVHGCVGAVSCPCCITGQWFQCDLGRANAASPSKYDTKDHWDTVSTGSRGYTAVSWEIGYCNFGLILSLVSLLSLLPYSKEGLRAVYLVKRHQIHYPLPHRKASLSHPGRNLWAVVPRAKFQIQTQGWVLGQLTSSATPATSPGAQNTGPSLHFWPSDIGPWGAVIGLL
jgi:hypothetical protein